MPELDFYAVVRGKYQITVPAAVRWIEDIEVGDVVHVTIEKVNKKGVDSDVAMAEGK